MFVTVVRKSALTTLLLLAACVGAGAALLLWPEATSTGVSRGLSICSSVIIPSLFPFLVLSGFLVKSGVSAALGRRLERPTRFLFGLPGCCAAGILIGFIGGYPAGAIAVGELMKQGALTPRQGRRMLAFCVNAGPAFILSTVGAGLLGSMTYGAMLLAAHAAAALVIGVLTRVLWPPAADETACLPSRSQRLAPATAFVEAVNSACRSLLYMCGFIILFAAVLSLADGSGLSGWITQGLRRLFDQWDLEPSVAGCLLPGLLEVSSGSIEAATTGSLAPLLLGMVMGWGGLSVHCQISATLHTYHLVDRRFFLARGAHALLGGLFSLILFRYVPVAVTTWNPQGSGWALSASGSAVSTLALLALCALFLPITIFAN